MSCWLPAPRPYCSPPISLAGRLSHHAAAKRSQGCQGAAPGVQRGAGHGDSCFFNTPWVCTHPWSHCLSTPDTAEERGAPGLAPGLRLGQHCLVQPLLHARSQNLNLGWGTGASSFPPSSQGSHSTYASIPAHSARETAEATANASVVRDPVIPPHSLRNMPPLDHAGLPSLSIPTCHPPAPSTPSSR